MTKPTLEQLRGACRGQIVTPNDADYEAARKVHNGMIDRRPALIVRCMSKSLEVFVFTGSAIKMEAQTEDHTVSFKFDDEPDRTERWPDSAEHDALFAPDQAAFASRLMTARTLRFGYTPHNAEPAVALFQVSGLGEMIEPSAKACGLKK